jgi:hypothetical protein
MQRLGDRWPDALGTHNRLLRDSFAAAGGREVDRQGDAFFAVSPRAREAVAAAVAAQRALAAEQWPEGEELRVRMGIHTGEPAVGDEGYLGVDVVRASRICGLASGAQILVSETTRALVRGDGTGLELVDLGVQPLKGLDEPERLFAVWEEGLGRELALRKPAQTLAVPARFEGRATQLAERARHALEQADVRVDELDQIGPRVEQGVAEMLRAMGVPGTAGPPAPAPPAPPRPPSAGDRHIQVGGRALMLGIVLVAVGVAAVLVLLDVI